MKNYFSILGLDQKFDLSKELIRKKYFESQKLYHPDKSSNSIRISITLNEAYSNVIDPFARAQHIFELNGLDIFSRAIDPRIFSKMTSDPDAHLESSWKRMVAAFNAGDLSTAYESWCECQYLKRFAGITNNFN